MSTRRMGHLGRSVAARHLTIAGWTWLVAVLGGIAIGVALPHVGYSSDLAILVAWPINLIAAYHLAKAATAQGRRGWLYGVVAAIWLMPAMVVYFFLKISERLGLPRPRPG